MGGVKVPQALRGVEEGILPPHWGKGRGGGCSPFPRKFFVFFVENTIF